MTELELMEAGELHYFYDEEINELAFRAQELVDKYNSTPANDEEAKNQIIKELLGKIGDYSCVKQPFHCDYGKFIEIGGGSFLNYDCIILGACKVIAAGNPCCVIREITEEDKKFWEDKKEQYLKNKDL